jgi:pilus assembly protein Flp/PilA
VFCVGSNSSGNKVSHSWGTMTMSRVLPSVYRFVTSEDGPTAVEYAVMTALIVVACISIITTLGKSVSSTFSTVNTALTAS